uniref:Uncharacterized protein LOC104234934 n=1 Tax=Nicotiana sylvestris TaxID=4096 RepID=A0A1U7XB58_NICSY|nr:PREDICTED: uncharacterized protein LOC104234934 [Nicotiana sylvestris]
MFTLTANSNLVDVFSRTTLTNNFSLLTLTTSKLCYLFPRGSDEFRMYFGWFWHLKAIDYVECLQVSHLRGPIRKCEHHAKLAFAILDRICEGGDLRFCKDSVVLAIVTELGEASHLWTAQGSHLS